MKKTVSTPTQTILNEFKAVLKVYIDPSEQDYLRSTGEKERIYTKLDTLKFCLIALGLKEEDMQQIIKEAHKNK